MVFSPQRALNLARIMTQPRRVGSSSERVVATEITNLLTEFGYQVELQPFQFYASFHGWIRLELVIGALLILTMMMLQRISSWAHLLPSILLIALIFLANPLHRWVQSSSILREDRPKLSPGNRFLSWLGSCLTSTNILATSPDLQKDDFVPYLLFMAHYDSKSQTLPLPIRMGLFALYILGGLSTAILTILSLLLPSLTSFIPFVAWGSLLLGIPLIAMRVGNDSPGAIDNASGVGLVLHLAEHLATNKDLLQKLKVDFLFTTAEEEGLMGAQAYVAANESTLISRAQTGGVYILNFDGIGTKGKLLMDGNSQKGKFQKGSSLGNCLSEICSELGIPLSQFPPIGALMDHAPFARLGLDAVSLASSGAAAWSVHTRGDTEEKLHSEGFDQTGRVALQLIQRLADKQNQ